MKVSEVMTHTVIRVGPGDDLSLAAARMWSEGVGCVVVVDEKEWVLGVITDRDIAMAAFLGGRKLADILVRDTMAPNVTVCMPEERVADVAHRMQELAVRRVPVIDGQGRLVGLLSISDLARAASHGLGLLGAPAVARTLDAIAHPPGGKTGK